MTRLLHMGFILTEYGTEACDASSVTLARPKVTKTLQRTPLDSAPAAFCIRKEMRRAVLSDTYYVTTYPTICKLSFR